MDFDRFEAWERGQDAQTQIKKKQSSSLKEYGGIERQYGLSKKAVPAVEKKRKNSSQSQSKKHKKSCQGLTGFGVSKEVDKRSKVQKWLIENEFGQPKDREVSSSFPKPHSYHPPILIDSSSSVDESHKENKKKRKEVKKEEASDDNCDFSPRSQKKMKPRPTSCEHRSNAASAHHRTISTNSQDSFSNKHSAVRRTISAPEGVPLKQPNKARNNLFENGFMKLENDGEHIDSANIKKEVEDDKPVYKKVNVHIKKEVKSPPKAAVRPASFILKPKGDDACVQTDINTNTLRDLLKCTEQLPPQLENETRYKWTVKVDNDHHLHKGCRKIFDGKGNDLTSWYTYLLDNYKSKREYKGVEGYSCFITLNSRYKVMLSSTESAEVEVLTDGSNEDNWMRNIRDPIRVYNFIDRPFYAQHIGESLSNKLPEIIVTRIFPQERS